MNPNTPLRLALLEDDPEQAEILMAWLKDAGHLAEHYSNGRSLASVLARESFDLLILDWETPNMSGVELLEAFRRDWGDTTPALVVSAMEGDQVHAEAIRRGANAFIAKPLNRDLLLNVLAALSVRNADA